MPVRDIILLSVPFVLAGLALLIHGINLGLILLQRRRCNACRRMACKWRVR